MKRKKGAILAHFNVLIYEKMLRPEMQLGFKKKHLARIYEKNDSLNSVCAV